MLDEINVFLFLVIRTPRKIMTSYYNMFVSTSCNLKSEGEIQFVFYYIISIQFSSLVYTYR